MYLRLCMESIFLKTAGTIFFIVWMSGMLDELRMFVVMVQWVEYVTGALSMMSMTHLFSPFSLLRNLLRCICSFGKEKVWSKGHYCSVALKSKVACRCKIVFFLQKIEESFEQGIAYGYYVVAIFLCVRYLLPIYFNPCDIGKCCGFQDHHQYKSHT